MVEQILRSISRSISQVGQETGQFRKAADGQNKSIGNFIKDISKMFSSQNKQQASINTSLDDIQYNSQQTNSKVSQSNDLIQESISIQTQMLSELRSVSKGIGSLIEGLGLGGFGGGGTGSKIASALMAGGIGAAAGALGGAGINFLSQQSGVDATSFSEGGQFAQTSIGGTTGQILDTIKNRESRGDYSITNKSGPGGSAASSASGAYQFIDGTWQGLTKKFGIGTEYDRAMQAPPEIQDAIAAKYVEDILARHNNDISWIPREWFAGPDGEMSEKEQSANRGITVEGYVNNWMKDFSANTGQNQNTPEGDGDVMAMSGPVNLQKYSLKPASHVQGLDNGFQQKLGKFFQEAEASGHDIKLYSGFRSPERQKELFANAVKKYGSPEAARKWVAPPGRSRHNYGLAADLKFLTPGAQEWAHQNASKYGLNFRMGHEPWHIEPIGASSNVPASSDGISFPMSGGLGFTGEQTGNEGYDQYMSQLGGLGGLGSAAAMLTQAGTSLLSGVSGLSFDNIASVFNNTGSESSSDGEFEENEESTGVENINNTSSKVTNLTPQPSVDNRSTLIDNNASQTQIASQMPSVPVSDRTQQGDIQGGQSGYTRTAGNMSLNGSKDTTLPDWYRSLFGVGGGRVVPDGEFYQTLA